MKRAPVSTPLLALFLLLSAGCVADPTVPGYYGGADLETPAASPTSGGDDNLLLPDLTTTTPLQLYVEALAGGRELRFSTALINGGEGPLRVIGSFGPGTGEATAVQEIERREGGRQERFVGSLLYDPTHGHWHLNNFAVFELWAYEPDGSLRTLLASSSKITFCLMDQVPADPPANTLAPFPEFIDCDWKQQGISEGWSETYDASLPGQKLDITSIPDGRYALRTSIDPDNLLMEANESNNWNVSFVELRGTDIEMLDSP
jgi:hypothetical protein